MIWCTPYLHYYYLCASWTSVRPYLLIWCTHIEDLSSLLWSVIIRNSIIITKLSSPTPSPSSLSLSSSIITICCCPLIGTDQQGWGRCQVIRTSYSEWHWSPSDVPYMGGRYKDDCDDDDNDRWWWWWVWWWWWW